MDVVSSMLHSVGSRSLVADANGQKKSTSLTSVLESFAACIIDPKTGELQGWFYDLKNAIGIKSISSMLLGAGVDIVKALQDLRKTIARKLGDQYGLEDWFTELQEFLGNKSVSSMLSGSGAKIAKALEDLRDSTTIKVGNELKLQVWLKDAIMSLGSECINHQLHQSGVRIKDKIESLRSAVATQDKISGIWYLDNNKLFNPAAMMNNHNAYPDADKLGFIYAENEDSIEASGNSTLEEDVM